MKTLLLTSITVLFASSVTAQESIPKNYRMGNELSSSVMNNLTTEQYEKKNISITAENGDMTYKSLKMLDDELREGAQLYKEEKFSEAYEVLSELSQWGVKEAQTIIGSMYIKGEHVDQSIERGIAWLGVAKEDGTDKSASKMFKYVYQQLNKEQQKVMDKKVDSYIAMYGSDAQNFKCKSRRAIGSNIREKKCLKTPGSNSKLHPIE